MASTKPLVVDLGSQWGGKTVLRELPRKQIRDRKVRRFWVRCKCGREFSVALLQLSRKTEWCQACKPDDWFGRIKKWGPRNKDERLSS